MKHMTTRTISFLLTLALLLQLLPASIFATQEDQTANEALTETEDLADGEELQNAEILFEEESLREENVKHFRLSDGTNVAVDYQQPVHYAASDGTWQDIDNRLIATENGPNGTAAYTSSIGNYQKVFSADLSENTLFSVSEGQYQITMGLPNAQGDTLMDTSTDEISASGEAAENHAAVVENESDMPTAEDALCIQESVPVAQVFLNEALSAEARENATIEEQAALPNLSASVVYEDAMQGADLHYESIGYDVKESILVKAPQVSYTYRFTLALTNLTAQLLPDGSVSIRSGEEEKYFIPAPYMVDATAAYSDAAAYTLTSTGNGTYLLTVTADSEWMNADDRAYPVQIDPTLCKYASTSNSAITNSFIRSASPDSTSSNGFVYCGKSTSANTAGSAMGVLQSYFYMSALPSLPSNSRIIKSYLSLCYSGHHGSGELLIRAFELTDSPSSGSYGDWIKSFTWNNHSAQSETMLDAVDLTTCTLYDYINWDITKAVIKWYQKSENNKGITLEANDAEHLYAYASFGGNAHHMNKPAFYVIYRNTVGIEPYDTYQTQSAGQAGTGYVADNNLQLTLLRTHLTEGSTVNPFSLTHVYNSAYGANQFTNGSAGIQTNDYSDMVLGAGWKLNVQETVRACSLADTAATYYVYNDADGTEHYFYYDSQTSKYRDEDGLNLTLTISGTTYTITDEKNNQRIFYNGYLSEIRDANGNSIYIAYNESSGHTLSDFNPTATSWHPSASGNQITSIYRKNDGGETEWLVSFAWDSSNRLSSVTDKVKNKTTYFYYTTDGNTVYLTGISAAGSAAYRVRYVYDTAGSKRLQEAYDVEAKRGIEYIYTGYSGRWDVYRIAEYYAPTYSGTKTYGAKMRSYQFDPYETSYRYYGDDRITSDDPIASGDTAAADDLVTNFYFDALGRTINAVGYNTDRARILGGSVTNFTQNNGTSAQNNRVVAQAGAGMFHSNLLKDSSFEACPVSLVDTVSDIWGLANNGGRVTFYNNTPHSGGVYASLQITETPTASTSYKAGIYQTAELQADQTYCFSAYLRINPTDEVWSYGRTYLYFADSNGNILSKGDEIAFGTGSIENGWMRIYVTYTPSSSSNYRVGICLDNAKASIGVDDIQLEVGAAPNSYNLLRDSSVEFYETWSTYEGWTTSNDAAIVDTSNTIDGNKAIQINGHTGEDRSAYQDVLVSEDYRTTYILSGWAKASSLPFEMAGVDDNTNHFFGLKATIYYTDDDCEDIYIPFNCYCEDWQYACGVVVPQKEITVNKIRVYVAYDNNAGAAYFDNIALTKEPVQTFDYDENGKLNAATDTGEEQSYTYDGADLTQYIGSNGTFDFEYDSYHNLTKATNDGVSMTMTYDNAGNVLTSKLTNTKDSIYLQSTADYSNNGNTIASSTDVNGNSTAYTYTMGSFPLTVTDAKNHKTTYTYDSDLRNSRIKYYANATDTTTTAELHYTYTAGTLSSLSRKTNSYKWHYLFIDSDIWGNTTAIRINTSTNNTGFALTENTYEANNGKLFSQKYSNGSGREYTYDLLDRLVEIRYYDK